MVVEILVLLYMILDWSQTVRTMMLQRMCCTYNNNFIKVPIDIYDINYTDMWSGVHTGDCLGVNGDI